MKTHLELYNTAGKTLMRWIRENPPEEVHPHAIAPYRQQYMMFYIEVEKELYRAYDEKEIDSDTYSKKCEALDEIDREINTALNKREEASVPPDIMALLKMLHDRGGKGGGGFIVFGGFP